MSNTRAAYHKQYNIDHRDEKVAYQKQYYEDNKDTKFFDSWMRNKYGITAIQYKEMWEDQKGLCAICGLPETRKRKGKTLRLTVDHCHATNVVRKLLCSNCNVLIGMANDSVQLLKLATEYLEQFNMEETCQQK